MVLRPRSALREHQTLGSDLATARRQVAILMRPGLGKTPTALDVLTRLKPRRTLVVAPAQVVETEVWSRETRAWEHTCHLSVREIQGDPEERLLQLILGADLEVISYDNFIWLTDNAKPERYEAIIFDELQKMKHPGTKRFKRMKAWSKNIQIRLGLTGSPQGNSWQDLWGEMYTVAFDKPLGPTKGQYLDTYFRALPGIDPRNPRYELRQDGSSDIIRQRIRPYAFSLKPKKILDQLPKIIPVELPLVTPAKLREMEKKLRQELELELDSGKTLMALNQSKLAMTIRQFSSGAVYTGDPGDSSQWEELHQVKQDALSEVVDELQGAPILVFIWFKHEAIRLQKKFGAVILGQSAKRDTVDAWNAKKIPMLVLHPQGSGLGLNLQYGSASAFWYTLPWSRELFDQGNGRLARIGQPEEFVTAHVPLLGAVDKRVWSAVQRKGEEEQATMDAVEIK